MLRTPNALIVFDIPGLIARSGRIIILYFIANYRKHYTAAEQTAIPKTDHPTKQDRM